MTKRTNTKTAEYSREEIAAQITAELLAAINEPRPRRTVAQWGADHLADAGDGLAEITAGVSAGIDNFKVSRESALMRQRQRTADRVAGLVEAQLKLRGL